MTALRGPKHQDPPPVRPAESRGVRLPPDPSSPDPLSSASAAQHPCKIAAVCSSAEPTLKYSLAQSFLASGQ